MPEIDGFEVCRHAFQPVSSTATELSLLAELLHAPRRAGRGLKVGLAISRNLSEAHHWQMALVPSAKGTTFLLTFPMQ